MNNTPKITKGSNRRSPVVAPQYRPSKRLVTFTSDELNNAIAQVPLSDGTTTIIDAASYHKLINSGVTDQWSISSDGDNRVYVRCRHKGQVITVSRLVLDAPPYSLIRHKNGDHRDLRRSNLKVIMKKASLYGV